jgi:ketosteroid isomerase-like protein
LQLIARTDHAGMLELWAEDGVDLMPGESPLVGKNAITKWLKAVESISPGSSVSKEELEFHDIRVSGDWASEWAVEHQVVRRKGKSTVEGHGKIALVLHRDTQGSWKIEQEMWNDSPPH